MSQPAPRAATAARSLAPRRAQPRALAPTLAPAPEPEDAALPEPAPGPGDAALPAPELAAEPRARRLRVLPILESAAMALGLAAAFGLLAHDLAGSGDDDGRVIPGVRLGGHEIGGMTADELPAIAEAAVLEALDRRLVLVAPGVEVATTARALGAVPAPEDAIAAALRVGRTGDPIADLRARDRALRGELDLAPGFRFH
ncbi:MAG TPA: hypothetical protein VIK91_07140, partial [Nannocystis sp.]